MRKCLHYGDEAGTGCMKQVSLDESALIFLRSCSNAIGEGCANGRGQRTGGGLDDRNNAMEYVRCVFCGVTLTA